MSMEQDKPSGHDLREIAAAFPELSPDTSMDEQARQNLETKYKILLQIADQSLRDRELRIKEGSSKTDRWANPLVVGIFAGAIGLAGTFVNGLISNNNQHVQLENELIKEAIKPQSVEERAKSLVFFANNGLITLDKHSLASLVKIAGNSQPVPGSSAALPASTDTTSFPGSAKPISYIQSIVNEIRTTPGVPYPNGVHPEAHFGDTLRRFIILHDAVGGDKAISILRNGMPSQSLPLLGPLAHWAVQSNGAIVFIANETMKANHVGRADHGVSNKNAIGISVTGIGALNNQKQIESLVRLVADVADRWQIPTSNILSHAEVSMGRKTDMRQQAPIVRQMVDSVRKQR